MSATSPDLGVSVLGIGYVGAVTSACISDTGFGVVAVDVNPDKVAQVNSGQSPIVEPQLDDLLRRNIDAKRLRATTDSESAVMETNLSIICVGTPSQPNGSLDLSHVVAVAEQVGTAIGRKNSFHSVVMRSTMLPGSMNNTIIPILERASQKKAGQDFGVAYYPEFLRESTAIDDYFNPAVSVMGRLDDKTIERLRLLNAKLDAPEFLADIATAEAIKYANNTWHATKITFANEIGNVCHAAGIDGQAVMAAVCADKRLNISSAYMKPGMAFGGSCLPKDLRALRYKARTLDVATPLLDAISDSNESQIDRAVKLITSRGRRRIGMLGLSFKEGTDDLRESPNVEIAERLHGKGYKLRIYDRNVHYSALVGSNLSYVRTHLPHLADLLSDNIDEVCDESDLIVIGNRDKRYDDVVSRSPQDKSIVDLVRIAPEMQSNGRYTGLCW